MAGEDEEIALLRQMQAAQGEMARTINGEARESGDDLPSDTEHTVEQVKKEPVADDQVSRAVSQSGADDSDGDYDPPPVTSLPAVTLKAEAEDLRAESRSPRKPKTVGGFIADDSSEGDDVSTPGSTTEGLLQPISTRTRSLSPSPLQNSVTQQDLQDQVDSKVNATPPAAATINGGDATTQLPPAQGAVDPPSTSAVTSKALPKARLPHDRIGILEDRIKEDPRGDLEAWFSLIDEHRKRNKLDDARAVYERFFKIFPQAAETWVQYIEMELEIDNFPAAENLFSKTLLAVPNVQLWSVYLNYIRRMNDVTNDMSGTARATVTQAYEFVLDNVGLDKESGRLWQEYIQFIRSGPGQVGGTSWQDQQKMDHLRKAYHRAIVVPMSSLTMLWKEYDQFEMGMNKMTGRKFLQERSPGYMTARTGNTALDNITRGLDRTTIPRLAPALGFEGDQDYLHQVELWKKWISWELEDPLVFKEENEHEKFKKRVLYVYKQAAMALRFWPEIWVDAADWCYVNGLEKDGDSFLAQGFAANPESCLIAFKQADRLESALSSELGLAEKGTIVRAPYAKLLDALYDLTNQMKVREARELAKLEESSAIDAQIGAIIGSSEDDEDDAADKAAREAEKANKTKAIRQGYEIQTQLLRRIISFAWVALMRAMRRVQGKGAAKTEVGGSRQIFAEARKRGKITSDVYVASALIEWRVYKDPAGTKIFERGTKLFPEDEGFILEYLKHLISLGDTTNARVAFETAVSRLTSKPETVHKAKPLYTYFHKYEAQYGELSQIRKLEQRMAECFPEDPKLQQFAARYQTDSFNPTAIRPIVSPATQMKPKSLVQSIEQPLLPDSPRPNHIRENSPRPQYLQPNVNSPKRAMPFDDLDSDRPRKLARGESPLAGAAGKRLEEQKRMAHNRGAPTWQSHGPTPFVVPRDITFFMSIIPRAEFLTPDMKIPPPEQLVRMLRETTIPDHSIFQMQQGRKQVHGMTSNKNKKPPKLVSSSGYYETKKFNRRADWSSTPFHGATAPSPASTTTFQGVATPSPAFTYGGNAVPLTPQPLRPFYQSVQQGYAQSVPPSPGYYQTGGGYPAGSTAWAPNPSYYNQGGGYR